MKDWNSTNASKYRNNKDFGFCSFPKCSGYTSYSFGAAKPWANVFVEKAVVRPGLLFWGLTHHLCLNLGLLFLICIDVVFTGTKFCLTSYCPVALSHSTVVILHSHHSFYGFGGLVSSINLISLLSIAFFWWLVNVLNDTSRTDLHRTSRFIPPLCFF